MSESMPAVGSRAQVFHGSASHTGGYLYKSDLMKNKRGEIVSVKKHNSAKKKGLPKGFKEHQFSKSKSRS